MKILIIHRDVGTGSVGKIVEDLYYGIKKSGNDCKIAYGYININQSSNQTLLPGLFFVTNKLRLIKKVKYLKKI